MADNKNTDDTGRIRKTREAIRRNTPRPTMRTSRTVETEGNTTITTKRFEGIGLTRHGRKA